MLFEIILNCFFWWMTFDFLNQVMNANASRAFHHRIGNTGDVEINVLVIHRKVELIRVITIFEITIFLHFVQSSFHRLPRSIDFSGRVFLAILAQATCVQTSSCLRGRRASRVRFLLLSFASCVSRIVMVRRGWTRWMFLRGGSRCSEDRGHLPSSGHRRSAVQLQLWSLRHNVSSGRHHQFLQVTPRTVRLREFQRSVCIDRQTRSPLQRSRGFRGWRQFFTHWETKTLQK